MDVFKQQTQSMDKEIEEDEFDSGICAENQMDMPTLQSSPSMIQQTGGMAKIEFSKAKVKKSSNIPINMIKTSEEMQLEKEPLRVRLTGKWFWKRVIVPPNAYVIHTRINRKEPITIGLGLSFRYKPNKDAYLIVPAAMQTIGVVANCISKEKQGINILAYVQWQIDDFSLAFKKLDFSDLRDPLGIVNAQLREQAEAAIKDKISTMSVEEVLTDKAPIIEELTSRLKQVAEGQNQGKSINEGLGIKIATVQIREAIVCSTSLWDDLQSPFRHEQKKKSSISYLEMQNEIKNKELITRKDRETREAETNLEIELTKQKKLTETLELKMNEEAQRFKKDQEVKQHKMKMEEQTVLSQKETQERILLKENELLQKRELEILKQASIKAEEEERIAFEAAKRQMSLQTERELFDASEQARLKEYDYQVKLNTVKLEKELNIKENELKILQQNYLEQLENLRQNESLNRTKVENLAHIELEESKNKLEVSYQSALTKLEKERQDIRNTMSANDLFSQLIQEMPDIAAQLPEIKELKVFQSGGSEGIVENLSGFIQKMLMIAETIGIKIPFKKSEETKK